MQFIVDWLYFQYLSQVKLNKLNCPNQIDFYQILFFETKKEK
tara:strand:- start:1340 stop:1465 length:126 start_codon:yes stop_codon:yes gene_type:complete